MKIIKFILKNSVIKSLWYNFFSKRVTRKNKALMIVGKHSVIKINKNAEIKITGSLNINANRIIGSSRETDIRLDENSKLLVKKGFSIYYGGDIIIFKGGCVTLGSGFFNSNIKIRCKSSITIGENVAISHDVTLMDFDGHRLLYDGYIDTKPIVIKNHVWIGTGCVILKGVTIGEGAIIAAKSVVTKDIPDHSIAAGSPAKVIRSNVIWE